ncbi:anti sigma factor C-terminal domain-containing protein [Metabacillus litoralis]|uniref:anti sigma factor C-terminal domain-containing protein n=1 Tax=Metabacillus litoralis TaxID=152268 RepID=UPI0020423CA4|nr:anti sigma factor C-terminal domain-containing protein [Metabacillus litoralis]MCM3409643.1 anti-sigma factor [Metabacillus litoralis]
MNDKQNSNQDQEINFTGNPSLHQVVKRSKRKQTMKTILIALISTIILLTFIFVGSGFILNKQINKLESSYDTVHGANIMRIGTTYDYNLFSVTAETHYQKKIGNRYIVWDMKTEKIPIIGKPEIINTGSGMMEMDRFDEEAQRYVRYNNFNNQRKIDFYYPKLDYTNLPHELEVAVELEENKLIEVALSFKEPITITDLGEQLGYVNVDWLWVDTTTEAQMKRMNTELDNDSVKTKGGEGAFGFAVSPDYPYSKGGKFDYIGLLERLSKNDRYKSSIKKAINNIKENTRTSNREIRLNGAVVTGTPKELKRFQELDFVRASVIGATIDKY